MNNFTTLQKPSKHRAGARFSTLALRDSVQKSKDFNGLEHSTNRYDLLLLVKRAGKNAGFSPRMIMLLDYYMSFTRDIDWEEGSSPVIYQSLSKTALDMGVTERQIQKLERALFDAGALTWHDSGNHKRYGKRDSKSGRILYAYGADLTPLAYLKPHLENIVHEKKLYDKAWMETKRQISWYRSQLRGVIGELATSSQDCTTLQKSYDDIAVQIRTNMDLSKLRALLAEHKALYTESVKLLERHEKTEKQTCKSEKKFVHIESTINQQSDKSAASSSDTGDHDDQISVSQAIDASSDSLRAYIDPTIKPSWNNYIDAAFRMREELDINQKSWARACSSLGRVGASLCVTLTDQARQRENNPVINTGGYFNALLNKAEIGELHLKPSLYHYLRNSNLQPTQHLQNV